MLYVSIYIYNVIYKNAKNVCQNVIKRITVTSLQAKYNRLMKYNNNKKNTHLPLSIVLECRSMFHRAMLNIFLWKSDSQAIKSNLSHILSLIPLFNFRHNNPLMIVNYFSIWQIVDIPSVSQCLFFCCSTVQVHWIHMNVNWFTLIVTTRRPIISISIHKIHN